MIFSVTFQALSLGPCSETRANMKKNQPEIMKAQENLAKPIQNQGDDLRKTKKSKQKYKSNNPKGARAKRAPLWGAAEGGALSFLWFLLALP